MLLIRFYTTTESILHYPIFSLLLTSNRYDSVKKLAVPARNSVPTVVCRSVKRKYRSKSCPTIFVNIVGRKRYQSKTFNPKRTFSETRCQTNKSSTWLGERWMISSFVNSGARLLPSWNHFPWYRSSHRSFGTFSSWISLGKMKAKASDFLPNLAGAKSDLSRGLPSFRCFHLFGDDDTSPHHTHHFIYHLNLVTNTGSLFSYTNTLEKHCFSQCKQVPCDDWLFELWNQNLLECKGKRHQDGSKHGSTTDGDRDQGSHWIFDFPPTDCHYPNCGLVRVRLDGSKQAPRTEISSR